MQSKALRLLACRDSPTTNPSGSVTSVVCQETGVVGSGHEESQSA